MSVVALKPYAADSSDPGLSGYTEFMKARMPNVDPTSPPNMPTWSPRR